MTAPDGLYEDSAMGRVEAEAREDYRASTWGLSAGDPDPWPDHDYESCLLPVTPFGICTAPVGHDGPCAAIGYTSGVIAVNPYEEDAPAGQAPQDQGPPTGPTGRTWFTGWWPPDAPAGECEWIESSRGERMSMLLVEVVRLRVAVLEYEEVQNISISTSGVVPLVSLMVESPEHTATKLGMSSDDVIWYLDEPTNEQPVYRSDQTAPSGIVYKLEVF